MNKALATNDETLFSDAELETLQSVVENFKNKTTNAIVTLNHKEKAWIENQEKRQLVDYDYVWEVRGSFLGILKI